MINTKYELIQLLPSIYQNLHIPLFLLDHDLKILHSPQLFLQLEPSFFQNMIHTKDIQQYNIYTLFYQKATYFFFQYPIEDIDYICIGPIFNHKITPQDSPLDYLFLQHVTSHYTLQDFYQLPYSHHHISKNITFIYQIITGNHIETTELKSSYKDVAISPLKEEQTLNEEIFQIRETSTHEFSYSYEQKILEYIKNENSSQARILMGELLQIKDERQLSQNQIQSLKYKLVCAVAVFTRGVIDASVPIAKAYTLSDVYIMKIDHATQADELRKMIYSIITDFTSLVKRYKHVQNPYWVKKCKDYVSHHLHQHMTLEDIAQIVDMNPHYLSTQFKKITGESIKQYMNRKKIEEAQFLIKNSDYSLVEISEILQFANQSHFNRVFKSIVGLTPTQYKNNDGTLKH